MDDPWGALDPAGRWLLRRSPALCRAVAYLVALLVAGAFVYHLARGSLAYLGLLEDDYFYYALVADKLVTLGRLTYDGTTLTNGFHPLWFVAVLLMRVLAGGLNGVFYAMLSAVFLASMVAVYELARTFARSLGASAALAPVVALFYAVAVDRVVSSGMETALDVPLLLWLLIEIARVSPAAAAATDGDGPGALTPMRAARLGLAASLAILARLDIALLVFFAIMGWLAFARPRLTELRRVALPFCAAGAAVPVYAVCNLLAFGTVLPVSALAKQLVKEHGVNLPYLHYVATQTPFGSSVGLLLLGGLVVAGLLWRRLAAARAAVPSTDGAAVIRPAALFAAALVLVFTCVFFGANALTGWTFFGWYAYPLMPSLVAALSLVGVALATTLSPRWRLRASAGLVAFVVLLTAVRGVRYFKIFALNWKVEDNGLLAMSIDLGERMRDRPGVYSMGAIGGFATYLLRQPVVQLEGLIADRAMVEHVRHEDGLRDVLRGYHVDYLIVSKYRAKMEMHDGCYVVTQPDAEWSGDRVARMHGEICSEPIAHFPTTLPVRPWSTFSTLDTYVFDVRDAGDAR